MEPKNQECFTLLRNLLHPGVDPTTLILALDEADDPDDPNLIHLTRILVTTTAGLLLNHAQTSGNVKEEDLRLLSRIWLDRRTYTPDEAIRTLHNCLTAAGPTRPLHLALSGNQSDRIRHLIPKTNPTITVRHRISTVRSTNDVLGVWVDGPAWTQPQIRAACDSFERAAKLTNPVQLLNTPASNQAPDRYNHDLIFRCKVSDTPHPFERLLNILIQDLTQRCNERFGGAEIRAYAH